MLLVSELPLASLPPAAPSDHSGASVRLLCDHVGFGEPSRWLYSERFQDTSELWRAVGISERGYLVRLFGNADFLLEKDSRTARVNAAPGAPPEAIEELFLDQVVPLWWPLLGRPCLHASAAVWGHGEGARAIAFAGRSGSGKSTLAASLVAPASSLAEEGALLADDCLAVELATHSVIAHPGHPAVRLLDDAAQALCASAAALEPSAGGAKRRIALVTARRAAPLARIYMLAASPDAPRLSPLRPRDAVARLATCFFRIDPEDRSRLAGELDLLERIAARTTVVELAVPRRFEALAAVRAAIAADLAGGSAT
jgi:hypothetical protein